MLMADAGVLHRDRSEDVDGGGGSGRMPAAQVRLRRAVRGDYPFARSLYVATMRPLLEELGAWNEAEILRRFRGAFRLRDGRVILLGDREVGWLHVRETRAEVVLVQIHLLPEARGKGIGSCIVRQVLAFGSAKSKPVFLNCVKNNPACALYLRLGFTVVGQHGCRLLMRWQPGGV